MNAPKVIKPNPQQQKCIDNIEGKYLVLAGPGTGKTFTLINRIRHMIMSDVSPEKILCLTFTDAAANEMKKRLSSDLGAKSIGINVFTYHGFCCDVLDEYADDFEMYDNVKVVSDSISRAFVKECIDELDPKAYRTTLNDPYYYIKEIKNNIGAIKHNRLTKEQYFYNLKHNPQWYPTLIGLQEDLKYRIAKGETRNKTIIGEIERQTAKIEKAEELWEFYELYQKKMLSNRYMDFNDMISLVLDKLEKDQSVLDKIANKYEYILVDEYQDTNKSQNQLVFLLTKALKTQNVFVVGDDDQIIYSFQGAKLDTIEKFIQEFPDTQVICLKENMRSTQNILDVARQIAIQDEQRLEANPKFKEYGIDKSIIAKNEKLSGFAKDVRLTQYVDQEQEYHAIVDEIETLINSEDFISDKNKLSEIAVLAKTNHELETISQFFRAKGIPYELKGGKSIFEIHAVNSMFLYMKALINPETYGFKLFQILLTPPFSFDVSDYNILKSKTSNNKNVIQALKDVDKTLLKDPTKLEVFIDTYDYLQSYRATENLKNTISEIGIKTGIIPYYLSSETNFVENVAGLSKLVDEAEDYSSVYKTCFLEDFINYLDILIVDEIDVLTDKAPINMNAVQLLTYYASKGREFEYVYMPTMIADKWESSKTRSENIPLDPSEYKDKDVIKREHIADCIKVMFVGMTRAKHTLRLSFVDAIEGKSKKPTIFIDKLKDLVAFESSEQYTEDSYWTMKSEYVNQRPYDYKQDFKGLIDAYVSSKEFAPTNVNSYISCPRQYLYQKILGFSGKDGNPNYANYGTAMHYACEMLVNKAKENRSYPSMEEFIGYFDDKIRTLPFTDHTQFENFKKRGHDALENNYAALTDTPIACLYKTEFSIPVEIDGINFTGNIDRIDKNLDGTYSIFDYKTGNLSSISSISLGKDHENYYMQMCLYKYVYEHLTGNKVSETSFIFLDQLDKKVTIKVDACACEEAWKIFKQAIEDMKEYKFEPSYDKNACKYCPFRDFCNIDLV